MPRPATSALALLLLASAGGCGGHAAAAATATITSVTFQTTSTLIIYGDPILASVSLHNPSSTLVAGPATLEVELRIDLVPEDTVIDTVSLPITLAN
jgi:hypothetical protein